MYKYVLLLLLLLLLLFSRVRWAGFRRGSGGLISSGGKFPGVGVQVSVLGKGVQISRVTIS